MKMICDRTLLSNAIGRRVQGRHPAQLAFRCWKAS